MTAKLEEFLAASLFSSSKAPSSTSSTPQQFQYTSQLEELIDLAGEQFAQDLLKAALRQSKGDIDQAYDLLLSGDQIQAQQEEKLQPTQPQESTLQNQDKCSVILHLLRKLAEVAPEVNELGLRSFSHYEQIRFANFSEKVWFEGKSGLISKREKKPILKDIKISNYNYLRKRSKK